MKKILAFISGVATYILLVLVISAYSNVTMHLFINEAIFNAFEQELENNEHFELLNYSIDKTKKVKGLAVTERGNFSITEKDVEKTMEEWLIHGGYSGDEPEALMALRHFYDPRGIVDGKQYLTDFPLGIQYGNPRIHIVEWALEYNGEVTKGTTGTFPLRQIYSWEDGKRSMILAMNTLDQDKQSRYFAEAWRSLGETLHAFGDLACPVHVRNDGHPVTDPDPYEDGLNKRSLIPTDPSHYWDEALVNRVRRTDSMRQLFHEMADYTNKNFFTNQTIWGKSNMGLIQPVLRPTNPYAFPFLYEDDLGWSYDRTTYTFYRDYGGTNTKMCKDRYYFEDIIPGVTRSLKAYIDLEVAKSQANVLLSNLIGSGPELIKRFLPVIDIYITEASIGDGLIKGRVDIEKSTEYPDPREYNSWIEIENLSTGKKTKIPVFNGQIIESQLSFTEGDKLQARIELGGIVVESDPYVVTDDYYRNYISQGNDISISCLFPKVLMHDNREYEIRFGSSVNDNNQYDQVSYQLVGQTLSISKSYDRISGNNQFKKSEDITLEFSSDFSRINNFKFIYEKMNKVGARTENFDIELIIKDIDFYVTGGSAGEPDSYLSFIVETKDNFKDKLVRFDYDYQWFDSYNQTGGDLSSVRINWSDPDATFPDYCLIYVKKI